MNLLHHSLDTLYPTACHLCGSPQDRGSYLCRPCRSELKRIESPHCETCGEHFYGKINDTFQCPNCHSLRYAFHFAKAAMRSTDENRQLILDFKYHRQRHLAPLLAELCAETIMSDPRFSALLDPVLIPVPLHWWRKCKRGFNQAEEISRHLSSYSDIPTLNALRRTRYTTTQTRLSRNKRLENLKDAFKLRRSLSSFRSAILIDDVFTTGSTANACAKVLKECANLENIVVLTALRG